MTQGHNIVAGGWAGASYPHPHSNLSSNLKHTQSIKNARFPTIPLDDHGPTDRRTDKASYRVACPQLKMIINLNDVVLTGNVLLLNLVDVTYNVIRSGLVVNKGAGCGWAGVEIPNDSQEWDL